MSRRRPSKTKRGSRAEAALYELCIQYGYCIPPDAAQAILANPPSDADGFVDAVLVAEGFDPNLILRQDRRPLVKIVTDWVYDEFGRGAISGLPLFPPVV